MCHLRNIAMRDYQESVTTAQTDGQTDKVIPMCRYASQATTGETKNREILKKNRNNNT